MGFAVQWRRAAAYVACLDDAGQILLTRFVSIGSPDSGKWTMPGGGMEWGETPEETARREVAEETGLSVRLGPVMGVFSQWLGPHEAYTGEPGHVLGIVYDGAETTGDLRTRFDGGTTDAAAWFSFDEASGLPRVPLVDFVLALIP